MTILGIGLDSRLSKSLSDLENRGFNAVRAENLVEAGTILSQMDLEVVMVDSHATTRIREDINTLLAETPLTTKIVLITHASDMISTETFRALGVKTIKSPATAQELEQLLS